MTQQRGDHPEKYTQEETYLSIDPLRGWRYWKLKHKRFWHRRTTSPLWLESPQAQDRWLPNDALIADCNNFSPARTWKTAGRKILAVITAALLIAFMIGLISQQFSPPEEPDSFMLHPSMLMLFVFLWLGMSTLVTVAVFGNAIGNRIARIRNPDARHEAPERNCMCGLYAAFQINDLFTEFEELRKAMHNKGKHVLIIGQVETAGTVDRAFAGSVGFRTTSMKITPAPLYMLNGTPELQKMLSQLYMQQVILGPPPTEHEAK